MEGIIFSSLAKAGGLVRQMLNEFNMSPIEAVLAVVAILIAITAMYLARAQYYKAREEYQRPRFGASSNGADPASMKPRPSGWKGRALARILGIW